MSLFPIEGPLPDLATARYSAIGPIVESGRVPIRTSRGQPRMALRYDIADTVMRLAPSSAEFRIADLDEFTARYRGRLDRHGPASVAARILSVPGVLERGAVLLCYENLTDGKTWCHRRVFADWWKDHTGAEVPDLEPIAAHHAQQPLL